MTFRFRLDENGHPVQIPTLSAPQSVASGAASAAVTNAFVSSAVRLQPTQDCFIVIGAAPTATSVGHFLAGGSSYDIDAGAGNKIAAIRAGSTDGVLYISELT